MPFLYFGFILTSILIFIIYQRKYGKYSNLPPGPPSLPIFGSIPLLNREKGNSDATLHKSFHKLYPDMYTLWLGSRPFIVIQDFNLAKDLFPREEFYGRPSNYHDKYIRGKNGHSLENCYRNRLLLARTKTFYFKTSQRSLIWTTKTRCDHSRRD